MKIHTQLPRPGDLARRQLGTLPDEQDRLSHASSSFASVVSGVASVSLSPRSQTAGEAAQSGRGCATKADQAGDGPEVIRYLGLATAGLIFHQGADLWLTVARPELEETVTAVAGEFRAGTVLITRVCCVLVVSTVALGAYVLYARTLCSAKQMLRRSGQEPEANVEAEGAVVFRPEPGSVYCRTGLRLGDLTSPENQEITRKIGSVLDCIEGSGQAGEAIGLNSAARAIVHRVSAGRGFSHETSEDKGEMLLFHVEKAPLRSRAPAVTIAPTTPRRLALSLPPRSSRDAPALEGASPSVSTCAISPATAVSGGTLFELELLRKENLQLRKELERSEARTSGLQTQLRAQHALRQASHNKAPTTGYDASVASVTLLPDSEWLSKAVVDLTPTADTSPKVIMATAYTYDCDQMTPALCAAAEAGAKVLLLVDEKNSRSCNDSLPRLQSLRESAVEVHVISGRPLSLIYPRQTGWSGALHAKTLLVDRGPTTCIYANYTRASRCNFEMVMRYETAEAEGDPRVETYKAWFSDMWDRSIPAKLDFEPRHRHREKGPPKGPDRGSSS